MMISAGSARRTSARELPDEFTKARSQLEKATGGKIVIERKQNPR
jgi:hypothetical protein